MFQVNGIGFVNKDGICLKVSLQLVKCGVRRVCVLGKHLVSIFDGCSVFPDPPSNVRCASVVIALNDRNGILRLPRLHGTDLLRREKGGKKKKKNPDTKDRFSMRRGLLCPKPEEEFITNRLGVAFPSGGLERGKKTSCVPSRTYTLHDW